MFTGALLAACGGSQHPDAAPAPADPAAAASGGDQVPPEKMDEINRNLERKRPIMSHCLAIAVDNKELPKNSRGKMTVDITIGPDGKASDVKIVNATLESKTLGECVVHHIQEIQFPAIPKPFETSYTYAFEAM
ncbi:MAG TPA: AgmX/PglI C-terminal domain-containing protein [Kofleriaceae bacterium]|nr:AgmX/PglI C-terminal domain-containing protein [Kofleriaceae bacterium]